jgi:hypothetical protein
MPVYASISRWRFAVSAFILTTGLHSWKSRSSCRVTREFGLAGKYAGQNYSTGSSNLVFQYFRNSIWMMDQCRRHGFQNHLFKVHLPH